MFNLWYLGPCLQIFQDVWSINDSFLVGCFVCLFLCFMWDFFLVLLWFQSDFYFIVISYLEGGGWINNLLFSHESSKHFHVTFHLEASNLMYPNHNMSPPILSSFFFILLCSWPQLMVAYTTHQTITPASSLNTYCPLLILSVSIQPSHFISSYFLFMSVFLSCCTVVNGLSAFILQHFTPVHPGRLASLSPLPTEKCKCYGITLIIAPVILNSFCNVISQYIFLRPWVLPTAGSLNMFLPFFAPSHFCIVYGSPKFRRPSFHIYFSNLPIKSYAQIKCSLLWKSFEDFLVKTKSSLIILYFSSCWAFIYLLFIIWLFTSNPVSPSNWHASLCRNFLFLLQGKYTSPSDW